MRTLTAALCALALIGCGSGDKNDDPTTGTRAGEPTGTSTGTGSGTGTGAGTGTGTGAVTDPDVDGDGSPASLDCDDADADRFPGNAELCDDVDHDCDGDPSNGLVFTDWYADADVDGYGDPLDVQSTCDGVAPVGYIATAGDCDDATGGVYPGATEICDGFDQDCDGYADNGLAFDTWYADGDQDGHGDPYGAVLTCDGAPAGYVATATDCDDGDADTYWGATELCDAVDNDCDEQVDNGIGSVWYADGDGDGYGDPTDSIYQCPPPAQRVADSQDCNDGSAAAYPGAPEACDGDDTDCNGLVDDGVIGPFWYIDLDGDGSAGATAVQACAAPAGTFAVSEDCDDGNPAIHPGADIHVCDLVDTDCDGLVEEWQVPLDGTLDTVIAAATAGDQVCISSQATGSFAVDRDLVIEGVGAAQQSVGQGPGSALDIGPGLVVELRNLRLTGGGGPGVTGGGLRIGDGSQVVLLDVEVENNTVEEQGGGIYVANNASLTMSGGTVRGNRVTGQGAAGTWMTGAGMFARAGSTVVLDGVAVEDNRVESPGPGRYARGGGIAADAADLVLYNVYVVGNRAEADTVEGAGLWVRNGSTLSGTRLDIRGNLALGMAAGRGGGVYLDNADATFDNLVLAGNLVFAQGPAGGSAVYQNQSSAAVAFATVFSNIDDGQSGAYTWWALGSTLSLSHVIVQDNESTLPTGRTFGGGTIPTTAYVSEYGNLPSTWTGPPPGGAGMVSVDAFFLDGSGFTVSAWDLRLGATSALIDAGDPTVSDADGSGADYGAFGGPGGTW